MSNLIITTPSDREIAMARTFNAPRKLVWDAHTKPELVKKWLLGPPGWSMPVCTIDVRVGGSYRYEWRKDSDGSTMAMGGVYREIVAPERIVSTEKFDDPWYEGEAQGTLVLKEQNGKTTLTTTVLYASKVIRDSVLKSGMTSGVEVSYNRLAEVLASPSRGTGKSILAVVAALVAVFILSLGTDEILHLLQVYPPWRQRMSDPLFALATAYRIVFNIAGGYIAARLAPSAPMRHAMILGIVGLVLSLLGVIGSLAKPELGPLWYPLILLILAVPCAWLGGKFATRRPA